MILHFIEFQQKVNIYAGLDRDGKPINAALGTYCDYKKKSGTDGNTYDSFEQFSKDLEKKCVHNPPKTGQFKFRPTSDLVGKQLYYQVSKKKYL